MLKKHLASAILAAGFMIGAAAHVQAQDAAAPPAKSPMIPIKVTVTISRYQGEKRISNLPYTISINLDPQARAGGAVGTGYASRRIGTRVPISTSATPQGGGAPVPKVEYQEVGTNIDCRAFVADDAGRFRLEITVDESSVYEDPAAKVIEIGRPTFRSFRTSESLMVRNAQSVQMSSTPDRMTGEVVRVDVALEVVK